MEKRYLVVSENRKTWDEYEDVFETLEEANQHANMDWSHLTPKEKAEHHIFVVEVTEAELREETKTGRISEEDWEDGNIPWTLPSSYSPADGGFDSEALEV